MTRTAAKRLLIVIAIFTLLAFASQTQVGAAEPPGHDDACRGANATECRPDPQPSHGQDCDPHGRNASGNDDHCLVSSDPDDTVHIPEDIEPTPKPSPAPDGPPSCDSSPEVHAECAALANGPRPGVGGEPIAEGDSSASCAEDDPCWDCTTMGNLICGPVLLPDTALPTP